MMMTMMTTVMLMIVLMMLTMMPMMMEVMMTMTMMLMMSNFKLHDWTLLQSTMKTPLITNQIELSLTTHQGFTNGDVAYLQERSVPIMAWSPLGGGSLMTGTGAAQDALAKIAAAHNVDNSAVAVAWLLAHPAQIMPVMGTNNINRIKSLSDALKVNMDRETWFELYTAALGTEVP